MAWDWSFRGVELVESPLLFRLVELSIAPYHSGCCEVWKHEYQWCALNWFKMIKISHPFFGDIHHYHVFSICIFHDLLVEDLSNGSVHDEHGKGQRPKSCHRFASEEARDGRRAGAQGITMHGFQKLGEERYEQHTTWLDDWVENGGMESPQYVWVWMLVDTDDSRSLLLQLDKVTISKTSESVCNLSGCFP